MSFKVEDRFVNSDYQHPSFSTGGPDGSPGPTPNQGSQSGPPVCLVPNCGRKHEAHGLCNAHYKRFQAGDIRADVPVGRSIEFWSRVDKTDADKCWEWNGPRKPTGYGRSSYLGATINAHRVAWMLTYGTIPDGQHVLHRCDNPPCCNPDHLFIGTHQDNMADRTAKFSGKRGEDHFRAKLTELDVLEIRKLYKPKTAGVGYRSLAKRFGVSGMNIRNILSGKIWRHLL